MKKKAIVLLVTIGFIAIITAIIMQTVSISKSSLDDLMALKRQNQLMLLMDDATKMIDSMDKEYLDEFLKSEQEIPIQDDKSGLSLTFSCIALKNRFDLTKLLKSSKSECTQVVKDFATYYELGSEDFFFKLLKQSDIATLQGLKKIKEDYLADTRDFYIENITKDKFEKVFFISDFNTTGYKEIDTNPSEDICKILNESDDCKLKFENKIKRCFKNDSNSTNQINIKNLIKCKINLYNGSHENRAVFKYDIKKKEIVSIDEFF